MTKEERAAAKAAKEAEREAKKAAKEAEEKQLKMLLDISEFFNNIYDNYLSLQFISAVDKVYFQTKSLGDENALFIFYDDFEFCRTYIRLDKMDGNVFYDWATSDEGSFVVTMEQIKILRKLSKKIPKATEKTTPKGIKYVPVSLDVEDNVFNLKCDVYDGVDKTGSERFKYVKGTRDYSNRVKKYIKDYKWDKEFHDVNWMFKDTVFKAYVKDDIITSEKTDHKILEVAIKNIFIEQKAEDTKYYLMTSNSNRNKLYIMLMSESPDQKVMVCQIMATVAY